MNPNKIVIKFEAVAEQEHGPVKRFVGFAMARHMVPLFCAADLTANPREPKAGGVTQSIIESIRLTPETFPFKTKGILISASDYTPLDRKRYELTFQNTRIEGILDGGHNMLAIGTHILAEATSDERVYKKVKRWPDLVELWERHRSEIDQLKHDSASEGVDKKLNFLVPLEILVPARLDEEEGISEFNSSLLEICAARNNNAELREEAKANKLGLYEELRKALPRKIAERIEWKTNDGGEVKVRDVIALSWIPLSVLDLPFAPKVSPQQIYASKGACVEAFNEFMGNQEVSKPQGGEYTHELHNTKVGSALAIAGQLPELFDEIYRKFPDAYNENKGNFGGITTVRLAKDYKTTKPTTHFTSKSVKYSYPDGYIMPLVYGLRALMRLDDNGNVVWKKDPHDFLEYHLVNIVGKYKVLLGAVGLDPQKIAKTDGYYTLVTDMFENEIRQSKEATSDRL